MLFHVYFFYFLHPVHLFCYVSVDLFGMYVLILVNLKV